MDGSGIGRRGVMMGAMAIGMTATAVPRAARTPTSDPEWRQHPNRPPSKAPAPCGRGAVQPLKAR